MLSTQQIHSLSKREQMTTLHYYAKEQGLFQRKGVGINEYDIK